MSLLQFIQYISHADLWKFLPQIFSSDWSELNAPARHTQSLNPNLHNLTKKGRAERNGFVSADVTGLAGVGHPHMIQIFF